MTRLGLWMIPVLMIAATSAQARMYQWTDADTGTVQMSGQPPEWYRTNITGPRVAVYSGGRLVDDTDRHTSSSENRELRSLALAELERRKAQAAREQAERQANLEEEAALKRRQAGQNLSADVKKMMDFIREQEYIKRLKSVVNEWDNRNPEAAQFADQSEQAAQSGLSGFIESLKGQ